MIRIPALRSELDSNSRPFGVLHHLITQFSPKDLEWFHQLRRSTFKWFWLRSKKELKAHPGNHQRRSVLARLKREFKTEARERKEKKKRNSE